MAEIATSPADPTTDKPPRRKRWIPVSVRILATIFVMMTFGILLPTVVRQYRQSVAREALEDRSASIETEYLAPHWLQDCVEEFLGETAAGMLTDVVEVDLMDADEPDLKWVASFPKLRRLDIEVRPHTGQFAEAGLAHLADLTELQTLEIRHTPLTDLGLVHLSRLTQLKFLSLRGTSITDEGLAHLAGLLQLQRLFLLETVVTEKGFAHLANMKGLCELEVGGNAEPFILSDAGVAQLGKLPQLRFSDLDWCKLEITDTGLLGWP